MKLGKWMMVGAAALAFGCGTDSSDGEIVAPSINSGKSDGLGVTVLSQLAFEEALTGAITADLQFDAYEFEAAEDAEVSIELTRKGSSSKLDSTMFLFGPKDGGAYPDKAIVFDDDDGFGKLSKIKDFTLFNEGTYMVVIGSKAQGRGHYNLELACENNACVPKVPAFDGCDPEMETMIAECMGFVFQESDFDLGDEPSNDELLSDCLVSVGSFASEDWFESEGPLFDTVGRGPAEKYFNFFCDASSNKPYCKNGLGDFRTKMVPACQEALTIPTLGDIGLKQFDLDDTLLNAIDFNVDQVCDDLCGLQVEAYTYTTDDDFSLEDITKQMAFDNGQFFGPTTTYAQKTQTSFLRRMDNFEALVEVMAAAEEGAGLDFGKNYEIGLAFDESVPFPSVDVTDEYFVIVDTDEKRIFTVEITTASE